MTSDGSRYGPPVYQPAGSNISTRSRAGTYHWSDTFFFHFQFWLRISLSSLLLNERYFYHWQ